MASTHYNKFYNTSGNTTKMEGLLDKQHIRSCIKKFRRRQFEASTIIHHLLLKSSISKIVNFVGKTMGSLLLLLKKTNINQGYIFLRRSG